MTAHRYLVAYDIRDDRRRRRAARELRGWGERIQRSVYVVELRADDIAAVRERLEAILAIDDDTVVIARIGRSFAPICIGIDTMTVPTRCWVVA